MVNCYKPRSTLGAQSWEYELTFYFFLNRNPSQAYKLPVDWHKLRIRSYAYDFTPSEERTCLKDANSF